MIVTRSSSEDKLYSRLTKGGARSPGFLLGLLFFNLCLVGLSISLFFYSPMETMKAWLEDRGFVENLRYPDTINPSGRAELLTLPEKMIKYARAGTEVPHLFIDIKFKHLQKLEERRKQALAVGILIQEGDDFVPAGIRLGNESFKVKLRLKGDWAESFMRGRWAFRVHVKGGKQLFGLRRFSLHHPSARNYHGEPMFHEFMRSEGILAPRYSFVDVTMNGDFLGRLALEEHFSKELLESQGRKESVIIKFDESRVWNSTDGPKLEHRGFWGVYDNFANAKIVPFRGSKIKESSGLSQHLKTATGLMRGFVNEELAASQAFDAELMGKFLAISHMWGAWHALRWHNERFYFNPITVKLEPIAFDGNVGDPYKWEDLINRPEPITSALLRDSSIWNVYAKTLNRLYQELKTGDRMKWLQSLQRENMNQLGKYYPFLQEYDFDELRVRTSKLLEAIREYEGLPPPTYIKYLSAHKFQEQGRDFIEVANLTPLPIELVSIQWNSHAGGHSIPFQSPILPQLPLMLGRTFQGGIPQYQTFEYIKPPTANQTDLTLDVSYRFQGQQRIHREEVSEFYPALRKNPIPQSNLDTVLQHFPFVSFDQNNTEVRIRKGKWKVNRPLVFPENVRVIVEAGANLLFSKQSFLLVRGPLMMNGEKENPVILKGQVKNPKGGSWQGVVVMRAREPSSWSHVHILDTSGINQPHWTLTGGVTFYESEIQMTDCQFGGNQAEDALNIVRTTFELTNVSIERAASDGLDVDFGKGTITDGTYAQIGFRGGGDAIDVSGSEVHVKGVHIREIADKGLSVGEKSVLRAENVFITQTAVGAVSKDGSLLEMNDSKIEANNSALMAYTKKPEHGPGKIIAENIAMKTNIVRVQDRSVIQLDGQVMPTEDIDVEELYNTSMKSGRKR